MSGKRLGLILFGVGLQMLSGCNLPFGAARLLSEATPQETATATAEVQAEASATQAQPTETPTPAPSPTDPIPPPPTTEVPRLTLSEDPIQPFAAGEEVVLSSIHMIDELNGWALGGATYDGDHVLRTSDGGLTWQDVTPPEGAPQGEQAEKTALGAFVNSQEAWVSYYFQGFGEIPLQPVVWRTQNGGENWHASAVIKGLGPAEFFVLNSLEVSPPKNGWLLLDVGVGMSKVYVILLRSVDGGDIWDAVIDPMTKDGGIQSCAKTGMAFSGPLDGWLTKDCGGVIEGAHIDRTRDGGVTWDRIELALTAELAAAFPTAESACRTYDPVLFSNEFGYVAVECNTFEEEEIVRGYALLSTEDGGQSWRSEAYPGGSLLFVDENSGWALGREIYQTEDGGRTWELVKAVNWDGQFSFVDPQNGWAVAREADEIALVHTIDGGANWKIIEPVIGP